MFKYLKKLLRLWGTNALDKPTAEAAIADRYQAEDDFLRTTSSSPIWWGESLTTPFSFSTAKGTSAPGTPGPSGSRALPPRDHRPALLPLLHQGGPGVRLACLRVEAGGGNRALRG